MSDGIDQGLAQCLRWIFVEPDTIQTDDTHGMARVALNESNGLLNGNRHRLAKVSVIGRVAVRFSPSISVGQYPALWKDGGRIASQKNYAGSRGIVPARVRVVPNQASREQTVQQGIFRNIWRLFLFRSRDQPPGNFMVEVCPTETLEGLELEI